jgi:hypothetical protein
MAIDPLQIFSPADVFNPPQGPGRKLAALRPPAIEAQVP